MNNIAIRGIVNITDIICEQVKDYQKVDKTTELVESYILQTDGTNLLEVMINQYVDHTDTYSNDIIETYNVLGIDAG